MSRQSEAELEQQLIGQLQELGYQRVNINDSTTLIANLKAQLEVFNQTTFTTKEFDSILNYLAKGTVFEKAKTLRDRYQLTKEDNTLFYVRFFDSKNRENNLYQVTHQITQKGKRVNRYDVTLLINGLPLVQIELKRRGTEIKEAFHQINRYQLDSFWSNYGVFQYVQLFAISNGTNTRYLANNFLQSVKQAFYWADVHNKNITDLIDFAQAFLAPSHLSEMIADFIVINETHRVMMVMRPYQYYAAKAIVNQVASTSIDETPENGYIWHTTGSGKTLTSFKASQNLIRLPHIYKVVFVVDRKDLDYQTMNEFNAFKKDSVDVTDSTKSLIAQLTDSTKLVLTTIQKLNNALSDRNHFKIKPLKDKRVIFIFDECHRSQFGHTHKRITHFFQNSQLFGFTGTPIFAENASKNELGKRTTKDLFGNCLHKYVITDAIRDQNVLRFGVEYIGRYKRKSKAEIDIEVEDIDKKEVFDDENRLEKITDFIIQYHKEKTHKKDYSALFAVSSIDHAIRYYNLFKKKDHDLRVTSIFTYAANEANADAQDYQPEEYRRDAAEDEGEYRNDHLNNSEENTRDQLDTIIADYNKMYQTSYSTQNSHDFENFFKDISKRLKEREKKSFNYEKDGLDIVIVVNMMLTGFDAKKVNTLYVDKRLQYHGLIQAYSRTNRIMGELKSQGNILVFRNLKKATDKAITLFSNKEAIEEIFLPDHKVVAEKLENAIKELRNIAPTYQSVDELLGEDQEELFVKAFRKVMRIMNALQSYVDFSWDSISMTEKEYYNYQSKYLDLHDKVKQDNQKEKTSILDDIDFELELIHRDIINVAYILKLLAQLKETKTNEYIAKRNAIIELIGGDIVLRSKRELIEKFIDENLPKIHDIDRIEDEFEQFWHDQKILALANICDEENLDRAQFKALIDAYIYSGQEPIRDDVFKCLDSRPSILLAREIGERILSKMRQFVDVYITGMRA